MRDQTRRDLGLEDPESEELLERYAPAAADDLAVERVWHRLLRTASAARARRRRVSLAVLVPAALASVAFWGLLFARRPTHRAAPPPVASLSSPAPAPATMAAVPKAEVSAALGGMFFTRPAESWRPSLRRQTLDEGERLRSDATGLAMLNVPGVASVLVGAETDLAIDKLGRVGSGTYLRLSHGSLVARVLKRPPGEPFVILTDRFSVKVVGTLFEVDQDAAGRTTVSVREGTVEVSGADGAAFRVEAGQRWRSTEPDRRDASAIPDSLAALLEAGLHGARTDDLQRQLEAVGPLANPVAPDATLARRTNPVAPESGLAQKQPPKPFPNPAPPPIVLAERGPMVHAQQNGPGPTPGIASAPQSAVDGAYANGLALERRGDFAGAASELAQAAEREPSHADLALYALGRLFQHRLNDPRRALEIFERYRSRYPRGTLSQEVDLAVMEIDVQTDDRRNALAESARFLAAHPASERTAEVHALRGNLLRAGGDCRKALAEYAAVANSSFAEAALFGTARCQEELGNGGAAREALRAYQARFPAGPHRDEVAKDLAAKDF